MEKVIIKADMIPEVEWYEIGKTPDGQQIMCRNRLSYEEKESLALALASVALYEDEVSEVCFGNYKYPMFECVLQTMYYTNLVGDNETIDGKAVEQIFDYVTSTKLYDDIRRIIDDDWFYIYEIYEIALASAKEVFNNEHSLSTKVKRSFASILNGEDIADTIARTEEATSSMEELLKAYDAVNTIAKTTDKIPIKDGVLNIGGTKLDQRKKEI